MSGGCAMRSPTLKSSGAARATRSTRPRHLHDSRDVQPALDPREPVDLDETIAFRASAAAGRLYLDTRRVTDHAGLCGNTPMRSAWRDGALMAPTAAQATRADRALNVGERQEPDRPVICVDNDSAADASDQRPQPTWMCVCGA